MIKQVRHLKICYKKLFRSAFTTVYYRPATWGGGRGQEEHFESAKNLFSC